MRELEKQSASRATRRIFAQCILEHGILRGRHAGAFIYKSAYGVILTSRVLPCCMYSV